MHMPRALSINTKPRRHFFNMQHLLKNTTFWAAKYYETAPLITRFEDVYSFETLCGCPPIPERLR